ncbi:AraC family transcriptional regulator [Brachybacterium sp. P6-10-X1]|uniref:AraC family transcriptional regulator n=1 Tax=Brachybacterium sp. P6-10-X1 TaxID=1903186 RepID=UPI0009719BE9|nr:AraC family transcriptional regulator [Brachybacterium sp. P6-10-X1]APX33898.1 AraC family transcriptional regulator [Brachybacterium sp. P6-10-X1]
MDTLTEVLDNIRASGALIGQSLLPAPWSVRVEAGATLTIAVMLRGDGWLLREDAQPRRLGTRDLVVLTGRGSTLLASEPDGRGDPARVLTIDGARGGTGCFLDECQVGLGAEVGASLLTAEHALLAGAFPTSGRIADRLLGALPPVLVVPRDQQRSRALDLLEVELEGCEPGQQAVLDRLLDVVLIGALRDWFALPEASAPAWFGAAGDPVVGPALGALHADPAREWTVEELARRAKVSRATFARRFAEAMGEPPISYLAGWRLCLAADLLQDGDHTLDAIARQVGYSSAYSLSAAFTREYGMAPSRYRRRARESVSP